MKNPSCFAALNVWAEQLGKANKAIKSRLKSRGEFCMEGVIPKECRSRSKLQKNPETTGAAAFKEQEGGGGIVPFGKEEALYIHCRYVKMIGK